MKTKQLHELERAITKWMEKECDDSDWPDVYAPDGLISNMAKAAAAVFDANAEGQIFAKDNK